MYWFCTTPTAGAVPKWNYKTLSLVGTPSAEECSAQTNTSARDVNNTNTTLHLSVRNREESAAEQEMGQAEITWESPRQIIGL